MEDLFAVITWRLRFGDPNPVGWCITVSYFIASVCCFLAARKCRGELADGNRISSRTLWLVLVTSLFALGVNKQIDLQTLLTQIGREVAQHNHWYQNRRTVQVIFVAMCAVVGVVTAGIGLRMMRGRINEFGLAYLGTVYLITFVVIRAASLHHVDVLLYHLPGVGNWVNTTLESLGILLVTCSAWLAIRKSRSASLGDDKTVEINPSR